MPKTVLIVEDDPSINELLVEAIKILGHETAAVLNTKTALESFKSSRKFDLITLDISLKGSADGNWLLNEINKIAPDIPVIVITATPKWAKPYPQVKEVFQKPFDLDEILEAIEKYLP